MLATREPAPSRQVGSSGTAHFSEVEKGDRSSIEGGTAMYRNRWALAALVALLGGILFTASAQAPDKKKTPATLEEDLAAEAKVQKAIAAKVLKAIGPAVRAQLAAGKQVTLPGIGVFQVVRISDYKDLA